LPASSLTSRIAGSAAQATALIRAHTTTTKKWCRTIRTIYRSVLPFAGGYELVLAIQPRPHGRGYSLSLLRSQASLRVGQPPKARHSPALARWSFPACRVARPPQGP